MGCHGVGFKKIMGIIKVIMNKVGGYLEKKNTVNLLIIFVISFYEGSAMMHYPLHYAL
jgi:hypothetical protein